MKSYGTPSIAVRAVKRVNNLSIGWVAPWNLDAAQTRIRVINVHRRLTSIGWFSKIINFEDAINRKFDIVVVGKDFSRYAYEQIKEIKRRYGSYIITDLCEDLFDVLTENDSCFERILTISDKVVCASRLLAEKVESRIHGNVQVIEDAIETDLTLNCAYIDDPDKKLKVVYLGYGGGSELLNPIKHIFKELNIELVEIHEWTSATIKWTRETWVQEVLKCDIAIIPQRVKDQPCKSANRLTQLWALGFPVIASPLDSYIQLIDNGVNAHIYNNESDLRQSLAYLSNWENRYNLGQKGKDIAKEFTISKITDKWLNVFDKTSKKLDIVIPTKNNIEYVEQLVESCVNSKNNVNLTTIFVDNSDNEDTINYLRKISKRYCIDLEEIYE